jgi:hypothetical protein
VRAGASRTFDGALILSPSGPADLALTFLLDGDAAGLVAEVALLGHDDGVLPAGMATALRLAVSVPADAAPGTRSGTLLIASGDTVLARIPFTVSVWTSDEPASPSPEGAVSISASPLPSPSGSAD